MTSPAFAWPDYAPPVNPDAPLADLIAESMQLSAFWKARTEKTDFSLSKRADLREHAAIPRRRRLLADPAERLRKLSIETGWDYRRGTFLAAPLEPWTCPDPDGAMAAYRDLVNDARGAGRLENWDTPRQLEWAKYLIDEGLAAVDPDAPWRLMPLSDATSRDSRKYPGAPVTDDQAAIGKQLRDHGPALLMAAHQNLSLGRSAARKRLRGRGCELASGGIRVAARDLCAEVNRIKARRPDLEECRYMSISTCRRLVRELIAAGMLTQLVPPRAVREGRTWKTIPRVLAMIPGPSAAEGPPSLRAQGKPAPGRAPARRWQVHEHPSHP